MKKKFTIAYTIFASAVMLFALFFLGYNLHKEYKQGSSRTASIFANTVFNLYQELDGIDETNKNFSKRVSRAAGNFQDYSFYELQKNGNTVYSYPANLSKEQTKSNFTKEFSTIVEMNDSNKYLLTCNIYLLRPYSIYNYSKIAFLIILAITVITFILILITGIKQKQSNNGEKDDEDLDLNFDEDYQEDFDSQNDFETELENDIKENVAAVTIEDDIIENIEKHKDKPEIDDGAIPEVKTAETHVIDNNLEEICLEDYDDKMEDIFGDNENIENKENNVKESNIDCACTSGTDSAVNISSGDSEPEGLFSHVTGLGWESYLLTRLDNELERSVASEMDISLFVIQITNLPRGSEKMKNICDYIVEQFQFRDLIFEYKEDCIVAIKNSTTLEDALAFADKIRTEIMKLLEGTDSNCYIGISTRTVRIISGERFLNEAEEALAHAREDSECYIIAFRADVEKYRRYIETKIEE